MAEQKPKKLFPTWGKVFGAHIGQVEIIFKSLGSLLVSIQKIIFSIKKLCISITSPYIVFIIGEKVDWQAFSAFIN